MLALANDILAFEISDIIGAALRNVCGTTKCGACFDGSPRVDNRKLSGPLLRLMSSAAVISGGFRCTAACLLTEDARM